MNRKGLRRSSFIVGSLHLASLFFPITVMANKDYVLRDNLEVVPPSLEEKKNYEVADLISAFMQPEGETNGFPWDVVTDGEILWSPDGVSYEDGTAYRNGIVRVNVLGEVSTVLRGKVKELFWSIGLASQENPGFGANWLVVRPGGDDEYNCFGVGNTMCSFDIERSLQNSPLKYEKGEICDVSSQRMKDMYRVSKNGYRDMYIIQEWNGGSGGGNTTLVATMDESMLPTNKEPCRY